MFYTGRRGGLSRGQLVGRPAVSPGAAARQARPPGRAGGGAQMAARLRGARLCPGGYASAAGGCRVGGSVVPGAPTGAARRLTGAWPANACNSGVVSSLGQKERDTAAGWRRPAVVYLALQRPVSPPTFQNARGLGERAVPRVRRPGARPARSPSSGRATPAGGRTDAR